MTGQSVGGCFQYISGIIGGHQQLLADLCCLQPYLNKSCILWEHVYGRWWEGCGGSLPSLVIVCQSATLLLCLYITALFWRKVLPFFNVVCLPISFILQTACSPSSLTHGQIMLLMIPDAKFRTTTGGVVT